MAPPTVWFCKGCDDGPHSIAIDDQCTSCGRYYDGSCRTEGYLSTIIQEASMPHIFPSAPGPFLNSYALSTPVSHSLTFGGSSNNPVPNHHNRHSHGYIKTRSYLNKGTTSPSNTAQDEDPTLSFHCCMCGEGPQLVAVHPQCGNCGHIPDACATCTVEAIP